MTEVTVSNSFGHTLKLTEHGGQYYPSFSKISELDTIRDMKFRDDDMIIISYPSSGTHWVFEIVSMLFHGVARSDKTEKFELFLEARSQEDMNNVASPRALNTHLPPGLISLSQFEKRKIIFVCRNPKDVTVSKFFHTYNMTALYGFDGDFQGYYELGMSGKVCYGTWWDHTKLWDSYFRSHKELDVLYLFYEDLKEDLESGVRQIACHLGIDADEQFVRDITDKCTFDRMKSDKSMTFPKEMLKFWRDGVFNINRKGQVGDWKNHFTVAMNERFESELQKSMEGCEIMKKIRYTI